MQKNEAKLISYSMLKPIAKTLVALNSNVRKEQLASGFAWGLLLALVPAANLFWVVLFIISFIPKNNYATQLFAMAVFKLLLPLASSLIDQFGWFILTYPALQDVFTEMYNLPFMLLTRFNNTLVMGGLVLGLLLWLPGFLLMQMLIPLYRNKLAPKIKNSKLYKGFLKIPLVSKLIRAVSTASDSSGLFK